MRRRPDRDVYTEVQQLMADLEEAGHAAAARKLEVAELGGSTGTEILFRLLGATRDLLRNEPGLPRPLRKRIKSIRREIGRVVR